MIVVVTGGRDHALSRAEFVAFIDVLDQLECKVLRHGGARGVDTDAANEVRQARPAIRVEVHLADWSLHGRGAGHIRNGAMLLGPPRADACVAFAGGRGTANCVAQAEALGVRVVRVGVA